ncbi:MAG TPA: hypothetical protein VFE46_02310 [Pirellulales bacterium]|jgi:hypothetical protein|nr:hypothetical protein [Pirellulales bacterium]
MSQGTSKIAIALLVIGYFVFAAAVLVAMFMVHESMVPALSTPQSQADWNQWRTEAAQQDGTHGPVQRVVPKSPEPPLLVLLRDYFPACVVGVLIPLSALYAVIAWMTCGVLRQAKEQAASRSGERG